MRRLWIDRDVFCVNVTPREKFDALFVARGDINTLEHKHINTNFGTDFDFAQPPEAVQDFEKTTKINHDKKPTEVSWRKKQSNQNHRSADS